MCKVWMLIIILLVCACTGNEGDFELEGSWSGPCQLHQINIEGVEVTYSQESLTFLSDSACEGLEENKDCGQASIEHAFYADEHCTNITTRLSPVISRYWLGERFVNPEGMEIFHFKFANGSDVIDPVDGLKTFIHGSANRLYFAQGESLQEVMEFSYYLERKSVGYINK